ncbi:hypothetical protein CDAR_589711 [Caerostris darwini]|uniref:Uncharacterized protein n=1 Tax=Caerostris darwini TaxID=1538125 RepID=A0AAV4PF26_9ARAC|nr:hypothetical protein CDAR_589711 [Caerostris darwini]
MSFKVQRLHMLLSQDDYEMNLLPAIDSGSIPASVIFALSSFNQSFWYLDKWIYCHPGTETRRREWVGGWGGERLRGTILSIEKDERESAAEEKLLSLYIKDQ